MAGPAVAQDASRYQIHFLTNRNVSETFDAYSALVRKDDSLTRAHYAFVAIIFAVNLFVPLAALSFAVRSQPQPSKVHFNRTADSTTASDPGDWMACRRYVTDDERIALQKCAVIDDHFCQAVSKVINSVCWLSQLFATCFLNTDIITHTNCGRIAE